MCSYTGDPMEHKPDPTLAELLKAASLDELNTAVPAILTRLRELLGLSEGASLLIRHDGSLLISDGLTRESVANLWAQMRDGPTNVVFGYGSASRALRTRDTRSFAIKASASDLALLAEADFPKLEFGRGFRFHDFGSRGQSQDLYTERLAGMLSLGVAAADYFVLVADPAGQLPNMLDQTAYKKACDELAAKGAPPAEEPIARNLMIDSAATGRFR